MIAPPLLSLFSAARALSGEAGTALRNPPWAGAEARILIARLSPIRDVDRSSAHLILFSELRAALPGAFVDFAFLPDRGDRDLLRGRGEGGRDLPWFFGAVSGASPADFDLILVSNAFGLELVNLPRLLASAGLPLRASERARLGSPILILGGSNAGQASALIDEGGDGLVDGLFLGEGEGALGQLAGALLDGRIPRAERLLAAARVEGFWPSLHPELKVRRRILRTSPPPLLSWPPLDSPEAKTARLQITAGCPGYCSFCFEGWDRRPYRELPFEEVLEAAREIRRRNGVETLEVYSFNFNTHEEIFALLFELGRIFKNVSLMSQRLDVLARTPGLVGAELAAGKRSFTLGVEGISARMRAYYRKGLSDEELERILELLLVPETREIKFFYILSGFEGAEDLEEFAAFLARLNERRKELAPGLRLLASAGYLVRLPSTPLGHAPLLLEEGPYAFLSRSIGEACAAQGVEWRVAVHFDEYCADQLLSLRGGALLPWLESLATAPPEQVYDGSLAKALWPGLEAFARGRGLLDEAFLGEKGAEAGPRIPYLEAEREGPVLHREYLAARDFLDREPCLGASCADCGACPDGESRRFLVRHRTRPAESGAEAKLRRLGAAKRAFVHLLVGVERPAGLAGASAEAQEAWLLRRLSAASPEAWKKIFGVRLVLPALEGDFGLAPGSFGWGAFVLEGPSAPALAELARAAASIPLEEGALPKGLSLELEVPPGLSALAFELGFLPRDPGTEELARSLLGDWLRESHIAATERRSGGGWDFELGKKELERRILHSARTRGSKLLLEIGPKARLQRLGSALGPRLAALLASSVRILPPEPPSA